MSQEDYYVTHFAEDVRTHLEAGAFKAICKHLSDRSAEIQNIDLSPFRQMVQIHQIALSLRFQPTVCNQKSNKEKGH